MPTWDAYYKEASRRRRATGGGRHLRVEKRRRRLRERVGIGLSALLVGAMTLIFYLVLTAERSAQRSAAASARNAAARWDSRFFSSSGSSAIVRPSAGTRNSGS